jgi:magnesium-transporting ATPase (P-type)
MLGSEDMNNSELHQWSRHYDSLLWQVTTLFAAAIGGLVVYSFANFHVGISVAGLGITCLPVYFAASFRESRDKVNEHLSHEERRILFERRTLKQWVPYSGVFFVLQALWVWLLLENIPELWWLWVPYGIVAVAFTIYCSRLGRARKANG